MILSIFIISAPIEDITLTMGDPEGDEFKNVADAQTLEFPEGHIQSVMCRVKGGYPKPKVEMAINNLHITEQFTLKQDSVNEGKYDFYSWCLSL